MEKKLYIKNNAEMNINIPNTHIFEYTDGWAFLFEKRKDSNLGRRGNPVPGQSPGGVAAPILVLPQAVPQKQPRFLTEITPPQLMPGYRQSDYTGLTHPVKQFHNRAKGTKGSFPQGRAEGRLP